MCPRHAIRLVVLEGCLTTFPLKWNRLRITGHPRGFLRRVASASLCQGVGCCAISTLVVGFCAIRGELCKVCAMRVRVVRHRLSDCVKLRHGRSLCVGGCIFGKLARSRGHVVVQPMFTVQPVSVVREHT